MRKVTPEEIKILYSNQIFVFGSNESGIHGAGAARLAYRKFEAKWGLGFGLAGYAFAIPTKDWNIQTLPLDVIEFYVKRFLAWVATEDAQWYNAIYVTEIGCGLAGYKPEDIAPFFKDALNYDNVHLPLSFHKILENESNIDAVSGS